MKDSYKDYIVNKKENDYQSLHLVIIVKNIPIEIQIRNSEMDYISKYGKTLIINNKYLCFILQIL